MITRYEQNKLTWIDVIAPTSDEIHELVTECDIPLTLATDLTSMTPRTDIVMEKKVIKTALDFPVVKRTDINHPHEIKFIVTKTHLITIRFEDIEAVDRFARNFEVLSILRSGSKKATGCDLFLTLLKHLYSAMSSKLEFLESRLTDIQEGIFAEHEKEMVFEISQVSRRLITFRHTIAAHEVVLDNMSNVIESAFGKNAATGVADLQTEYDQLTRRLASLARLRDELRETNNSLLSTKQNEVMKTFTILAFITFPLTLFTSMFGMNTATTPIIGKPGDFWIILSIMVFVSITFFAYFRYKKWM